VANTKATASHTVVSSAILIKTARQPFCFKAHCMVLRNTPDLTPTRGKSDVDIEAGRQLCDEGRFPGTSHTKDGTEALEISWPRVLATSCCSSLNVSVHHI